MLRQQRPFSSDEDDMIRKMYELQGIKKWGMIASAVSEKSGVSRNAKHCRDRYHQFLDPEISPEWTPEEEKRMYGLHEQIGNKWAIIANYFPGKNDNCVKNHFYSKLRKALRHLNKSIKKNFRKDFKQLKIGALYKIIEALEDRFNQNSIVDEGQVENGLKLKNQLLQYADEEQQQNEHTVEMERKLIVDIYEFSRGYKRKSKKDRRSSFNGSDLFKPSSTRLVLKYSSDHESEDSDYSFALSHGSENDYNEHDVKKQQNNLVMIEEDLRESYNSKYSALKNSVSPKREEGEMVDEGGIRSSQQSAQNSIPNSVEEILKGKGALEYGELENIIFNKPGARSQRSISLRSESSRPDMFGADDIRISAGLQKINDMEEEDADDSLFRSQK